MKPVERNGAVRRESVGIDKHAIGPVYFVAHVEHGLILHALTTSIEIMTSGKDRRRDVPNRKQFDKPLVDRVASGKRIENGARVGVLLVYPLLHGGRGGVLKPAIAIENFRSVKNVDDGLGLGDGGRVRRARRLALKRAARERSRDKKKKTEKKQQSRDKKKRRQKRNRNKSHKSAPPRHEHLERS